MDNKSKAISFLTMASSGYINEAFAEFIGVEFKHHNPFFEGTAEALKAGMNANARQNPARGMEVKRVIVEGDFVVTHTHVWSAPEQRGAAVIHIFRFEDGRIVELWDVGQPVPETSVNQHEMF